MSNSMSNNMDFPEIDEDDPRVSTVPPVPTIKEPTDTQIQQILEVHWQALLTTINKRPYNIYDLTWENFEERWQSIINDTRGASPIFSEYFQHNGVFNITESVITENHRKLFYITKINEFPTSGNRTRSVNTINFNLTTGKEGTFNKSFDALLIEILKDDSILENKPNIQQKINSAIKKLKPPDVRGRRHKHNSVKKRKKLGKKLNSDKKKNSKRKKGKKTTGN